MNMKRFMNKKVVAIGLAAGLTLGAAGAAFAYFTTTGGSNTSGVASTGSAGAVTVSTPTTLDAALVPSALNDGNAIVDTYNFTITNAADQANFVTQYVVSIPSTWSVTDTNGDPACTAADFDINGATGPQTVAVGKDLLPDSDTPDSLSESFTLQLVDNGANQDSCEGITTVPLSVVAS